MQLQKEHTYIIWKTVYKNIRICDDEIKQTRQQNKFAYLQYGTWFTSY